LLHVQYINPGNVLLASKGKIDESLFEDGLHPNTAGYEKLGGQLASYLK
jgi:lysophospholipase L1-like esterase